MGINIEVIKTGNYLMKHILISYRDNSSFSLYTMKLFRDGEKKLNNKNWIEFDDKGEEQFCANSFGASHVLIQNCSQDELEAATSIQPIKFRIVDERELTEKSDSYFGSKYKLNISKVLSKPLIIKSGAEYQQSDHDKSQIPDTLKPSRLADSKSNKSEHVFSKGVSTTPKNRDIFAHFRSLKSIPKSEESKEMTEISYLKLR